MRSYFINKPKPMLHLALAGALLFAAPPVSLSALPSQEAENALKPLQYEVAVTLKLIQVYVTDRKGNPVMDLAPDDFIVFDNGRPVTITEFEQHDLFAAPPNSGSAPSAERAVSLPVPPPRKMNRKFFLFIDFAYNNQRGVDKSVKTALHFLDTQLVPGDEVALLSCSMMRGITVHEYLTVDHDKVRQAVRAVTARGIAGRASEIEEEYWRKAQEALALPRSAEQRAIGITGFFDWQRQESKILAQNYMLRLIALAKALRMIPGQKSFLFFSTGVPNSLIYGTQAGNPQQPYHSSILDMGDQTLRPLNEEMIKELSAANCSFYVFDTREAAMVPSLFAYDEQTFEDGFRDIFSDIGIFETTTNPFRDGKTTGLASLKRLSDRTAGKFFSNINMYAKNLDQVQDLTGAYYVLGFSIDEQRDGEFHEIKVEVGRKGCEVRAQSGYFNPKPFREYTDLEKRLHLFDLALNERSQLQTPKMLTISALSYKAGEECRLRMMSRIPRETLAALAGKQVEFVALAFNDRENLVGLQQAETDTIKYQGKNILFAAEMAVPPGRYTCRLVLRDLETGRSAVASTRVSIAKTSAEFGLQAPLLLALASASVYLESVETRQQERLSWREIYPFDRTRYSPLIGDISKATGRVLAVVPYTISGLDQPHVILSANLIDALTGKRLAVPFYAQARFRNGATEIQYLEFSLEEVPPGKYLLYIHAGDPDSGAMAHVQTTLVVVS
jgi:VWFA-related protein